MPEWCGNRIRRFVLITEQPRVRVIDIEQKSVAETTGQFDFDGVVVRLAIRCMAPKCGIELSPLAPSRICGRSRQTLHWPRRTCVHANRSRHVARLVSEI